MQSSTNKKELTEFESEKILNTNEIKWLQSFDGFEDLNKEELVKALEFIHQMSELALAIKNRTRTL